MPDHTTPRPVVPPRWRDYLYPVTTAAVLLAGGYGLVTDELAPLWIGLAAALLGTGTATAYRPARTLPHASDE